MIWFQLAQDRFTKSPRLRAIEQILVERAVGADTRAEGNVDVQMTDWTCSGRRVAFIDVQLRSRHPERFRSYGARVVIPAVTHKIRQTVLSFRAESRNLWLETLIPQQWETSLDMTNLRNLALVLFCAITSGLAQSPQTAPTPSIVYAVHDPGSIKDYKTNPRVVREMVNRLGSRRDRTV